MNKSALLFLIIFLEGYIVLSVELLAMRQSLPFVGGGTDTVSIIIAAVLMPLAFGYYAGGRFRPEKTRKGGFKGIRRRLIRNLLVSQIILTFGLSYFVLDILFADILMDTLEWRNRLLMTTIYVLIFVVTPVYLLGQTVPLTSNYFSRTRLAHAAGKILFFSTVGSFLGAVFSTLLLMNTIGVSHTATVTMAALAFLVFLLAPRKKFAPLGFSFLLFGIAAFLNSGPMMKRMDIVASNVYNTVQITEHGAKVPVRYMRLNRSYSSAILPQTDELGFPYAKYIDDNFINTFKRNHRKGKILVVGAGGFTLGMNDKWNEYVFVDIDPDLKEIAEKDFLKQPLGPNKKFIAEPARAFLNKDRQLYDLIILDAFRGPAAVPPEHLVTREFFLQVRDHMKDDGIMVAHFHASQMLGDDFSRNLHTTLHSVFPYLNRQNVFGLNPWKEEQKPTSILYFSHKPSIPVHIGIYTDDLNRAILDGPTDAGP